MRLRALVAAAAVAAFVAVACFLEPDPAANPDATLTPAPLTPPPVRATPTPMPAPPADLSGNV